MEVQTHIHIDPPRSGNSFVSAQNKTVALKIPDGLANCGFPARDVTFDLAASSTPPSSGGPLDAAMMLASQVDSIAAGFATNRTSSVVFAFGTNAVSKRQGIIAKTGGLAHAVLSKVVALAASTVSASPIVAVAYGMGDTEVLKDLVDVTNDAARLTETVREGPRVNDLTCKTLSSAADVNAFCAAVSGACEQKWPSAAAATNFMHEAIVITVYRFESPEIAAAHAQQQQQQQAPADAGGSVTEMNSLHFIVLPDNQRPALCGIDSGELKRFEFAQKSIAGAAGVVGAILAARLRVPFGKSRLTGLLKRAYNAERGNKYNSDNKPTATHAVLCVSAAEEQAEETYHIFALLKRLYNPLGFASSTLTLTRDMSAEKWRLDQDVVELRDELNIARQVFGYKPSIVDQPKPVANIHEVEQSRISDILKRREEARLKQQQELEQRAKAEAAALIENEERMSGATLRELEDQVSRVRREFELAESEHGKKRSEHERQMEKIRKKRAEEEDQAELLRQQVAQLEDEINSKEVELARRRRQIEAASQDASNSRASAMKERDELQAKRAKLQEERRALRANWLEEIRATNERLLAQVTSLEAARKKLQAGGAAAETEGAAAAAAATSPQREYETESGVREDIKSINEYLPRLIALEDVPAEIDQSESIRQQLEQYFEQEKSSYAARLEEEKKNLANLEKDLLELKGKAKEVNTNRRRELLAEAVKKEHHVQSIIDQVMQYLQNGVRLQKVSSNGQVRRRLFFISEDCKKIFACDLDESGAPINRRKPTMTMFVNEISEVILGCYTPSFMAFAGKANIKQQRDDAMKDGGTFSLQPGHATPTPLSPVNLGKYNYRSFTLMLPKQEKSVELVCDTDSDWEAWLLALKRLVNFKTPYERKIDAKCQRPSPAATAEMHWGEPMEMRNRADYELLYPEEITFCASNHIAPKLFLKTRDDVKQLQAQMVITVYDIRKSSSMDLLRSQSLLDFFVSRGIVQSIYG